MGLCTSMALLSLTSRQVRLSIAQSPSSVAFQDAFDHLVWAWHLPLDHSLSLPSQLRLDPVEATRLVRFEVGRRNLRRASLPRTLRSSKRSRRLSLHWKEAHSPVGYMAFRYRSSRLNESKQISCCRRNARVGLGASNFHGPQSDTYNLGWVNFKKLLVLRKKRSNALVFLGLMRKEPRCNFITLMTQGDYIRHNNQGCDLKSSVRSSVATRTADTTVPHYHRLHKQCNAVF